MAWIWQLELCLEWVPGREPKPCLEKTAELEPDPELSLEKVPALVQVLEPLLSLLRPELEPQAEAEPGPGPGRGPECESP